jgi:2-phosphosulfolactate phosphatase
VTPRVEVADFVEGARLARGLVVVIDVFRAFSLACYATAGGVKRIHPVAAAAEALALKRDHPDWLLAGERHARKLAGFDFGNSPTEIQAADLNGRTLVHTTHAGTQGLCAAQSADTVLTGSLVNAGAVCRHIQARRPAVVTLVRMGHEARERCDEDDLCAELIRARVLGVRFDATGVRERLAIAPSARKFFDPDAWWAPQTDFELCTRVDCFDFVLRLTGGAGGLPWLEALPA